MRGWNRAASLMGIVEDYHGFYDPAFEGCVLRMLRDALTEVAPREYLPSEVVDETTLPDRGATPIALVHRAWCALFADDTDYGSWETEAIERWLD